MFKNRKFLHEDPQSRYHKNGHCDHSDSPSINPLNSVCFQYRGTFTCIYFEVK